MSKHQERKKFVQEIIFPLLYLNIYTRVTYNDNFMDGFCEVTDFLTQIEILVFFEEFGILHFKFAILLTGEYTFVGHIYFEI